MINLARDQNRAARFYQQLPPDWPFAKPKRFNATDGTLVPEPPWWKAGPAAWGCFRSHQSAIENALNDGVESLLVLEDDARCATDFTSQLHSFAHELPRDWEWVYFGGQHIQRERGLPVQISEHVYRPFNAHRLHAYGLRGGRVMQMICEHLADRSRWGEKNHVDHRLGELHASFPGGLYCPDRWLIGQAAGFSNIKRKHLGENFFPDARWHYEAEINYPVVAVVGEDSFLRKLTAFVLHRIGVPMGNAQPADTPEQAIDSYAAPGFDALCDQLVRDPFWYPTNNTEFRMAHLRMWASRRSESMPVESTAIGATHSKLAMMLNEASTAWNRPRLIVASRNLRSEPAPSESGMDHYVSGQIKKSLRQLNEHDFEGVLRLGHEEWKRPSSIVESILSFIGKSPSIATAFTTKQALATAMKRHPFH